MFCKCPVCTNIRRLGQAEQRTRSQVLIDGVISVDFPPEAYAHSLKYGYNCGDIKYILATHSHMDHFYAHDFILRGYRYASDFGGTLHIYGNSEVAAVFNECTAREMKPSVKPNIDLTVIGAYTTFKMGGYTVATLPAKHSTTEQALLYYVSDGKSGYLHLYDTGLPECDFGYLTKTGAKVNVVSLDCTYLNRTGIPRPRHMNLEDRLLVIKRLKEAGICANECRFVITHFSHNSNPLTGRMAALENEYGVTAAYDGMEVEV